MIGMEFKELLSVTGGAISATSSAAIPGRVGRVVTDSRSVEPGDVFVALPGGVRDGVEFLPDAAKRGAVAAIVGPSGGHEYQMIDDRHWQQQPLSQTGTFYAVLPRAVKLTEPVRIDKWNQSRIKVQGKKVEHWLNGQKILTYTLGSDRVLAGVAKSKFKKFPGFGKKVVGRILLTDHKDRCEFRNLQIREIK